MKKTSRVSPTNGDNPNILTWQRFEFKVIVPRCCFQTCTKLWTFSWNHLEGLYVRMSEWAHVRRKEKKLKLKKRCHTSITSKWTMSMCCKQKHFSQRNINVTSGLLHALLRRHRNVPVVVNCSDPDNLLPCSEHVKGKLRTFPQVHVWKWLMWDSAHPIFKLSCNKLRVS